MQAEPPSFCTLLCGHTGPDTLQVLHQPAVLRFAGAAKGIGSGLVHASRGGINVWGQGAAGLVSNDALVPATQAWQAEQQEIARDAEDIKESGAFCRKNERDGEQSVAASKRG